MANPSRRGSSGEPVRNSMQGGNYTPWTNTHFVLPYGLRLQQKVGMSTITNVSGNGTTVTYTVANSYSAGDTVSIYDVNPVAYNLQNATIASASSTQFTITNAATGTYVSGGTAQKTGAITVTIPSGITFVYAIAVGGGGPAGATGAYGGGAGGVAWGWTLATTSCVVGAPVGGTTGNYTRYGNVIAGGGGYSTGFLGGGGGSGAGSTNYWGIPGGTVGTAPAKSGSGSGAASGSGSSTNGVAGGAGGDGISGGAGGLSNGAGSGTNTAGAGGSGLVGGGGGRALNSTTSNVGGVGGNGINILTGAVTTGGTATTNGSGSSGAGGGGAGIAGNGGNASGTTGGLGGLGGGGGGAGVTQNVGGAGILYLFY